LFEQADVRAAVAADLRSRLGAAARVGFPAVLGLEHHVEAWRDLQDLLGMPVFEIPTLRLAYREYASTMPSKPR